MTQADRDAIAKRIAQKIAKEPCGAYSNEVYLGALEGLRQATPPAPEPVAGVVTQADRIAWCEYEDFEGAFRASVLRGEQDSTAGLHVFVRHRLASTPQPPTPDAQLPVDEHGVSACPFCGARLSYSSGKFNKVGRCDTEGCWLHERKMTVPVDALDRIEQFNQRTSPPTVVEGESGEGWREIQQNIQPRLSEGYTGVMVSRPGYWLVTGPGPASALNPQPREGRT